MDETGTTRKVISLGKASYAIILPKEWVKSNQIEKGGEVLVFPQKNGQIIIQKPSSTRKRITLNAENFNEDSLDAAIQSTYQLNIDETVVNFPETGEFTEEINHITDLSKKLAGLNLSISGSNQVTISNLFNMMKIRISEVFDQLLAILALLIEQIARQEYDWDNTNQLAQMEGKYRLGVRLLIFALKNQHLQFEAGMNNIIQVLGSRVVLFALRSFILQIINLIPMLKSSDVPNLSEILIQAGDLTQKVVRSLSKPNIETIKEIQDAWTVLEGDVTKMEEINGFVREFFTSFRETLMTLKEVVVTRFIEGIEIIDEENEIT